MLLKYVDLGLENCEVIRIDGKYIGEFELSDFETVIARMACNDISKSTTANFFAIEISKEANKEPYMPFGDKEYETTIFKRLTKYHDITSVSFKFYDQYAEDESENDKYEEEFYWVHYYESGELLGAYNLDEETYISELGNLYIIISKTDERFTVGNKVDAYFNLEDINDKEYMDFHFDMCDVEYDKE